MLEKEPSWLAEFGPFRPRGEPAAGPAVELRPEKATFGLRIDLGEEGSARPVLAQRDACAVLLDGFLHDRAPLASAISANSQGSTDAEFILAAFLELGDRMLPLLRGSFALVVWDGRDCSIVCARDLTGLHPLFFSHEGERVLAAASQGALLDVGRVPAEFDRLAIARWVMTGSALPRRTFYRRVERLPPGYGLFAGPHQLRISRYWHPGERPAANLSPEEAVERFDALLDQAVARAASHARLGIFLSGGVDSAAVAASATAVSRTGSLSDPLALSHVYPHADANEEVAQRTVAAALGIPLHIVPLRDTVGPDGLLVAALQLTEQAWMPPVNPWESAFVHLAGEAARQNCRTIVSGEGGNHWFEAERYEAADLLRRLKIIELTRVWSQERRAGRRGLDMAHSLLWTNGLRVLLRHGVLVAARGASGRALEIARRRRIHAWLPKDWFLPDEALRTALADEWRQNAAVDRSTSFRDAARERALDSVSLVAPVENRFLFGRRIGVHFSNPAVDPDLVEFLFWLPVSLINLGGRGKGLAWESARRRTGAFAARALGFAWLDRYFARLLQDEVPGAIDALGGITLLAEAGIVEPKSFVDGLPAAGGNGLDYYQVWQTLACEAWLRSRD